MRVVRGEKMKQKRMNCRQICYAKESNGENEDQETRNAVLARGSLSTFIAGVNGGVVVGGDE